MTRATISDPHAASPEVTLPPERVDTELATLANGLESLIGARLVAVLAVGSIGRGYAEGAGASRVGAEDYDVIMIVDRMSEIDRWLRRRRIDRWLRRQRHRFGVPVSVGILHRRALGRLPFTLFNYELRFAHRVLRGRDVVRELPSYTDERMPLIEATRLLLNRGVALWETCVRLSAGELQEIDARAVTFQNRKAWLAVGDSLLIASHCYHWSYAGRLERMVACPLFERFADHRVADRYKTALGEKLRGDVPGGDAAAAVSEAPALLQLYEAVYREVEERRLGEALPDWRAYAASSFPYPRDITPHTLKRLLRLWRAFGAPRGRGFYRANYRRTAEAILLSGFPMLAFDDARDGELPRLLNCPPTLAVSAADVWTRFHHAWSRSH